MQLEAAGNMWHLRSMLLLLLLLSPQDRVDIRHMTGAGVCRLFSMWLPIICCCCCCCWLLLLLSSQDSDDIRYMAGALKALGVKLEENWEQGLMTVHGCGGRFPAEVRGAGWYPRLKHVF
jgi:hypothetical protein